MADCDGFPGRPFPTTSPRSIAIGRSSVSVPGGQMKLRVFALAVVVLAAVVSHASAGQDVVLYASDVTTIQGNWSRVANSMGAGGQLMSSADNGWSSANTALAAPADYFEATFTAAAGTQYHVWLRLRASGNSKWNDSVWVQFN